MSQVLQTKKCHENIYQQSTAFSPTGKKSGWDTLYPHETSIQTRILLSAAQPSMFPWHISITTVCPFKCIYIVNFLYKTRRIPKFISSCSCLCLIPWSHVFSREWRCSWSNADRRCSHYIWVINKFIAYCLILEIWRYMSFVRYVAVFWFLFLFCLCRCPKWYHNTIIIYALFCFDEMLWWVSLMHML